VVRGPRLEVASTDLKGRTVKRTIVLLVFICLAVVAAFAQGTIQYPNPIKHVVLIIQENRTPDNLFHGLLTYPGINPTNYDLASSGLALVNGQEQTITLTPVRLATDFDLGHAHADFFVMYDSGKMDGANQIPDSCNPHAPDCKNGGQGQNLSYEYVQSSDVQPYLDMAAQYGWANLFFQSNQGPTFAAHQYLFSGTSAQDAASDAKGILVAGNPQSSKGDNYIGLQDTGCLAPIDEYNYLVYPSSARNLYTLTNDPLGSLCFNHDTLATLLDDAQLSWKYYAPPMSGNPYPNDPSKKGYNPGGFIENATNSFYSICQPDPTYETCNGPEYTANLDLNPPDVLTDIASCNLAVMNWVTPIGQASDHPGNINGGEGPSWVSAVVNTIGNNTNCDGAGYWSDTVILVVWDDWGGWYDHEVPTISSGLWGDNEHGFRVPFVVLSAYTPQAYVSNQRHDFGSVVRFVEGVLDLGEGTLGFADARSSTDLNEFFDFKMKPRQFRTINAPLNAEYFLNDKRIPDPPDDY
jgi:phospholipase C